ncbi:MAG: ASKHA domain-containing protein, partial [Treponema sp.]|nr:ASKHA domain-containing protein [Treponema sp.]
EEYAEGWRLACGVKTDAELTVLVPDIAQAYKSRMKVTALSEPRERAAFEALQRELEDMGFHGDSGLEPVTVHLKQPALDDAMADQERLLRTIATQTGKAAGISFFALRKLPKVLRESDFSCIGVLRKGPEDLIMDVFPVPGDDAKTAPVVPGLAIDIGTTTVVMVLTDLKTGTLLAAGSSGNGQIRYGADVISRIIQSTRPGGIERLRRAVVDECIVPLIKGVCDTAGILPEQIYRVVVAGNTTMSHLFTGISAKYLRLEPYVPAFFQSSSFRGADLGIGVHPDAEVILAPNIGSYVGGDITAGVFSSMIFKKSSFSLFIDLGTNGELVFGNQEFLISCACSAGPAFEGGDISCGMRATDGAIEACAIDEETMEPRPTIIGPVGQKPVGICGSGLIDIIGELFRCDIINAKGKFIREGKRIQRDTWGIGSYMVAFASETESGRDLALNEVDIDNFIRAKGAIFSAIRTMLIMVDFTMDAIEEVYVAGGIGSGINVERAIRIGMLPNLPLEKFHYIGNTSLTGAYAMVNSRKVCDKVTKISQGMTYLELSSHPGYMDEFVAACFLPHTNGALFE